MLTVEDYSRIRRAYRDGMSIREIARRLHHSRRKVRQALAEPQPRPYTRTEPVHCPVLGPFKPIIDRILKDDAKAPRKQRHTAAQIHRRLQTEHGYPGGYDQVRRYVASQHKRHRETFIPLSHDPGQRMEADFGHIYVDFPEGRRQVPVLLCTWAYSNRPFAIALPTERVEAVLTGMVAALEFFGCVPREVWWDNPKTVVKELLKGRQRRMNPYYAALASHYTFEPLFCMPAKGNEKPRVENRVYDLQRRWATPVPRVKDLDELNQHLRRQCLAEQQRIVSGQTETIGLRFERDRQAALPLSLRPFDPCIHQPAKVDKYQTVAFDANRYSVPRRHAFEAVTVKAYVDRIEIAACGQVVARHWRSYARGEQILDPLHYLVTLGRRPAALDRSDVYRNWRLPAVFSELRTLLEGRHGASTGARQYVRVLQLLADHPLTRVRQAIEYCRLKGMPDAEPICRQVERLAMRTEQSVPLEIPAGNPEMQVNVPLPNLSLFNQLLSIGEPNDERQHHHVVENQPETAAAANYLCRVCQTGE
jgi:transposase